MSGSLNFARLRVFDAVARTGTFAAAAEQLSYTPSAVSQQMARLEAEVGTVLVDRTARGVQLTPAGELLHARARRILDEVREAYADLQALAGVTSGEVRLGSFPTATQTITTAALKLYRERFGGVAVTLVDDEPHHTLERLRARRLDLALLFRWPGRPIGVDYRGARVAPDDGVELTVLFADPYVAILPEGHRLASAEALDVGALRDELFVGSPRTPGMDQLAALGQAAGFTPLFTGHALPDYESVRALVHTGDGIALIPRLAAGRPYEGTVTRRLIGPAPTRDVLLARPEGAPTSPATSAMTSVLLELVADLKLQPDA